MYVVCTGAKFLSLKPNMILAKRSWGKGKKKREGEEGGGDLLKHFHLQLRKDRESRSRSNREGEVKRRA